MDLVSNEVRLHKDEVDAYKEAVRELLNIVQHLVRLTSSFIGSDAASNMLGVIDSVQCKLEAFKK